MQKVKNTPRSFRDRARSNAREIILALALTVCSAGFMVAAFQSGASGSNQMANPAPSQR
jgi:hypothetical protein